MFNEIQIAQLGYVNYVAKHNKLQEVEAETVRMPNMIGRIVVAVRAAITHHTPKLRQSDTVTVRSGAVAR